MNVEYNQEYMKSLVTYEFLKELRNQLFRIHNYYNIDTFAENGISMNEGTNGWYASFGKACINTNNGELLEYFKSLTWYDGETLASNLSDMLIENKLILGYVAEIIEEKLGLSENDVNMCDECGRLLPMDSLEKVEIDVFGYQLFKCHYCIDLENSGDNKYTTKYYRDCLKEIDEYTKGVE